MAGLTPEQIAQKWSNNLGAAGPQITAGVNAVSVAPGQAAARAADVWASNTAAAKPKYQRNVAAVSLSDWQQATLNKGVQRIASGAQAAMPKFATFMTQFLPHLQAGKAALPPRGNLEQNLNRMMAMARHNAQFTYKRTGV